MSNGALWATRVAPGANSRNAGSTAPMAGSSATAASVMPVSTEMNAGIGMPGLTRVWNSPSTSPPRTLTAPISVIAHEAGDPPVVSRSTTTKVRSDQWRAEVVERQRPRSCDGSGARRASAPEPAVPCGMFSPPPEKRLEGSPWLIDPTS